MYSLYFKVLLGLFIMYDKMLIFHNNSLNK